MTPLIRLLALAFWSAACTPIQTVGVFFKRKYARRFPMFYHRGVLRILGINIIRKGEMRTVAPTLFVANHISYLDIFVLGAVIEGSFVAKSEISGWPVAGYLARLQRTIFVERERRAAAGAQRDMLQSRFEEPANVILFPEGTSFDGARVLPFKSALFAAAERQVDGHPVIVQPLSIAYVAVDGLPLTRAQRPSVAWYGDMALLPHIWEFAKAGRTTVTLDFHPPISMESYANRRTMAADCREIVASGVRSLVSGRPALPPPPPQPALPAPEDGAPAAAATIAQNA